jgi:citrate synthase
MTARKARFDSRGDGYLDAAAACDVLAVKRATLYTYASRGLVRAIENGRERLYVEDDVRRLAERSAARKGHAAAAASALRWGEPVLDSAISTVADGTLRYRGHDVRALVARGASFEEVAEILLEGPFDRRPLAPSRDRVHADDSLLFRVVRALPAIASKDASRLVDQGARELERASAIVRRIAAIIAGPGKSRASIAELVAGGIGPRPVDASSVELALVVCADHELNQSTFAARIAASAGADLYSCIGAALHVFLGTRHGTASDRVEAVVDALPARGVDRAVRAMLARGERPPGFGHPLYPAGDPRGALLVERARGLGRTRRASRALAFIDAAGEILGEAPSLDGGLVALTAAIGAHRGASAALFGLGRSVGWIAHSLEQRAQGTLLRPRARYVGRPPI